MRYAICDMRYAMKSPHAPPAKPSAYQCFSSHSVFYHTSLDQHTPHLNLSRTDNGLASNQTPLSQAQGHAHQSSSSESHSSESSSSKSKSSPLNGPISPYTHFRCALRALYVSSALSRPGS